MKKLTDTTTATAIGGRIRAERERRGWTQMELAIRCGMTPSRISEYETGAEQPSIKSGRTFCAVFGWKLDWLFEGAVER